MRAYARQGIPEDEAIFNYRMSRTRRVIENAFGTLAARWRILMQPIQAKVKKTELIVKSTICLHNFLRQTNSATYFSTGFVDTYDETGEIKEGEWQKLAGDGQGMLLENIDPLRGCRPTNSTIGVRDFLKTYVNSFEGSLSWQWGHVRSRGNVKE